MKKTFKLILAGMLALNISAVASNVAVVDSGTYFDHDWFQNKAWFNKHERAGNNVDDDRNGKVDDVNGWNFADNYKKVFYPEHISGIHPVVYRIFFILSKIELGTITEEDRKFWEDNVASLPEDKKMKLRNHLNYYGQYAHGTHCSGVIASGNEQVKIMSARIFPDAQPPEAHEPFGYIFSFLNKVNGNVPQSSWMYDLFARESNKIFITVSDYLNETKMEVANYSIGVPLALVAKKYLALAGNQNPTPEELSAETKKIFASFDPIGKKWMKKSSGTLFVVAAGNETSDNDLLPIFPANVDVSNSISVAATNGYKSLANFSNFGANTVHVAAPGVAIMSSVPGPKRDFRVPMSGTSMAVPFVTMVASNIKNINPGLKPMDVKKILMSTVDVKAWLSGKVVSSGIVNQNRAYRAAEYSLIRPLKEAIEESKLEVEDNPEESAIITSRYFGKEVKPTKQMLYWAKKLVF